MNAVKRGFFSLWYRKKTALLLFCVFLILAALVLAGFSMLEACRQEERALREQVGATVTLNNYHTEEADLYAGSNQISQESVEKIEALGLSHPEYGHLPLLLSSDGRRLAKRDRDLELGELQRQYAAPEIVGALACAAHLIDCPEAITPQELLPLFSWAKLPREDLVWHMW